MGCNNSTSVGSVRDDKKIDNRSVQDDARSFRSKVGAIKMLTKNTESRAAFVHYLNQNGKSEFYICYQDLEEIRMLSDDQKSSRLIGLIARYKSMYETVKIHGLRPDKLELLIWEGLGKLRHADIEASSKELITNYIISAQNGMLDRLIPAFEGFLQSSVYKNWQEQQIKHEKKDVEHNNERYSSSSRGRLPTCSDTYPDVLIVDDSITTLKLTGLTLEKDGHNVERATNGEIALNLMISRPYDVVLIDLNMPVMDGFETVRLFRDHESKTTTNNIPSDVSSISDESVGASSIRRMNMQKNGHSRGTDNKLSNGANNNLKKNLSQDNVDSQPTTQDSLNLTASVMKERGARTNVTAAHFHQLIIGMSSNVDEETRIRAIASGMDFFLPKPFTLEKFIDTIRASKEPAIISASENINAREEIYRK